MSISQSISRRAVSLTEQASRINQLCIVTTVIQLLSLQEFCTWNYSYPSTKGSLHSVSWLGTSCQWSILQMWLCWQQNHGHDTASCHEQHLKTSDKWIIYGAWIIGIPIIPHGESPLLMDSLTLPSIFTKTTRPCHAFWTKKPAHMSTNFDQKIPESNHYTPGI